MSTVLDTIFNIALMIAMLFGIAIFALVFTLLMQVFS